MGRFIKALAAACVLTAGLAATMAMPAWGSKPAGLGPEVHVVNLQPAYEAHLGRTKPGKIAGITYPRGKGPKATAAQATSSCVEPDCPLVYNGGPVQQHPHVYLLFWGPAWASDSGEEASASYLESFYAGLGAQPDDNWSTTTDQYGDSSGYPSFSGSVYEGAFQDTSTPSYGATQSQLAAEADAFASSKGITDLVDAQIVVATQSGTCPQGFAGQSCGGTAEYCAWHSVSNEPYTNLPYMLDAGGSCGENFVNSGAAGTDDGFSIVGGHEYAETITDPGAGSGWIDYSDGSGGEIGDKCAWRTPSGDVTLSTGTFAMQSLWSNAAYAATASGCVMSTSPAATATGLSSSANPVLVGQQVVYTAAVSPVPDGGTVAFSDGGGAISGCGSVAVDTSTGKASCDVSYATVAGSPHSIKATYSGNGDYAGSPSSVVSEVVDPAATATGLSSSANPVLVGQQVVYTAAVSPVPDGGTVAFSDGGGAISGCGSVAVDTSTGKASCDVSYATVAGSPHSIKATYTGDSDYQGSESSALPESVQAPPPPPPPPPPSGSGSGGSGGSGAVGGGGVGGGPSVTVSGSPKSTGSGVRDTVTCSAPAGQSCRVTLLLMTTEILKGGKPFAVSASVAKTKHKTVVVGTKSVTVAGGQSATITGELGGLGRRLLKRFGKLPVIVSIELERNGQLVTVARGTVTIKPSKHPGKSFDLLVPMPLIRF